MEGKVLGVAQGKPSSVEKQWERLCLKSYRNGALLHIPNVSLGFSALPVLVDVE